MLEWMLQHTMQVWPKLFGCNHPLSTSRLITVLESLASLVVISTGQGEGLR